MSITKSYNKHTDTYYAYDTTYVWDEASQKKVQKKVCIGQYDSKTGNVVPNARRGRPSKYQNVAETQSNSLNMVPTMNPAYNSNHICEELENAILLMAEMESSINELSRQIQQLRERAVSLKTSLPEKELP